MWGSCKPEWRLVALVFCWTALSVCSKAQAPPFPAVTRADPVVRLDLSNLGFAGMSRMARVTDESDFSLDFIDSDHVLVIFNRHELLRRKPGCTSSHSDRVMRALVVRVSTGAVKAETDWYLHDRSRYLWPLGSGRFLLRKLNSLYQVDASLNEKLLYQSPEGLLYVGTTPDGRQIIVERPDPEAVLQSKTDEYANPPSVRIEFLDSHSLETARVLRVSGSVGLQATTAGFADATRLKRDTWLVRFGPDVSKRANIARVKGYCTPEILHPSASTLLIGRCSSENGYALSAYSTDGERLWKARWHKRQLRPTVVPSRDGSRFLLSTLTLPETDFARSEEQDEGLLPFDQHIEVRETASGSLVFAGTATSYMGGQNVALSPDGRRLALLNETMIDVYVLPRVTRDEQQRYEALDNRPPKLPTPPLRIPVNLAMDAVSLRLSMLDWVQGNSGAIELPLSMPAAQEAATQGGQLPELEPD